MGKNKEKTEQPEQLEQVDALLPEIEWETAPGAEQEAAAEQAAEQAEAEPPAPPASGLQSLATLADRHRVPAWQQAALLRLTGWAEGKQVTEAEYAEALEQLKHRRIGGGRR